MQADETFTGGKGAEKQIVLLAIEEFGRSRMIHAPGNHEAVIEHDAEGEIAADALVKTDGHAAYNKNSLGGRCHDPAIQTQDERQADDHLQLLHWLASNLKRWLLGTHHGAVRPKHLQSYLDEFSFRHNRRKTNGTGRNVARCLENMLAHPPLTRRQLIDNTQECRYFQTLSY